MSRPGIEVVPEQPTEELPTVEHPAAGDAPPGSILAGLRERASLQREAHRLDLEIGGAFEDSLVVRYRLLPMDEWDQYGALLTGVAEGAAMPITALTVRLMATACETVLYRGEDGELHDLEVRIDGRLWTLLGWDLPANTTAEDLTPREVIGALFPSFFAMGAHSSKLVQWMQNPAGGEPGEA